MLPYQLSIHVFLCLLFPLFNEMNSHIYQNDIDWLLGKYKKKTNWNWDPNTQTHSIHEHKKKNKWMIEWIIIPSGEFNLGPCLYTFPNEWNCHFWIWMSFILWMEMDIGIIFAIAYVIASKTKAIVGRMALFRLYSFASSPPYICKHEHSNEKKNTMSNMALIHTEEHTEQFNYIFFCEIRISCELRRKDNVE